MIHMYVLEILNHIIYNNNNSLKMFSRVLKVAKPIIGLTKMMPILPKANFCSQKPVGVNNCRLGNISSDSYYGMRPVRRCSQEQIQLLEQGYQKLIDEKKITTHDSQINWYSIFMNGDLTMPKDQFWLKFHNAISNLFYETEGKQQKMYSYGILVNPTNSQKDQFYHFDYAGQTGTLFISMVYHTTQNSTQYLNDFVPKSKPDLGPRNYNCYGYNDIELLQKENVDFLEVSQVICRPFVIMKGGKRTIHRGIRNRTGIPRPILYMNFGVQDYVVNEPARHSFEDQKVWRQELQKQGAYKDYYKE